MESNPKILCSLEQKQSFEIENQAQVIEYLATFLANGRQRITESDVSEIHRLTIQNIYPCAGNYRGVLTRIEITGTDHKPAHASQVQIEVRDMLDWLEKEGRLQSPVHRASYVLWKVNAIHPFNGGNGRVARALAYLVILTEVAPIFAGESLPTKLKSRKQHYLEALSAADKGDLNKMELLVLECLKEQVADIAGASRK